MCGSTVDIQPATAEIRRGDNKEERGRTDYRAKILWPALFHRAAIISCELWLSAKASNMTELCDCDLLRLITTYYDWPSDEDETDAQDRETNGESDNKYDGNGQSCNSSSITHVHANLPVKLAWQTSGYATMVHGRECNPHRPTTTFANLEITSLWRHNLGSRWKLQKMAWENFSIGALYNITKNQDNPIKTVGRDSFLSRKPPKNTSF